MSTFSLNVHAHGCSNLYFVYVVLDQEAVNAHIRGIFGIETGFKGTIFSEAAMLAVSYFSNQIFFFYPFQLQSKGKHHHQGTKTTK